MNKSKALLLGTLMAGAALVSNNASAYVAKYEGNYVMSSSCSITLTAAVGFDVVAGSTGAEGTSVEAIGDSFNHSFNLSCDTVVLDDMEILELYNKTLDACMGAILPELPGNLSQEQLCANGAYHATLKAVEVASSIESEILYSLNIDVVKDFWFHGESIVDYAFADGRSERRRPFIWNGGKFYRGYNSDSITPNAIPYICVGKRVGKMDVNVDRHSSFGGGARAYIDNNFVDAVVCPVYDIVNDQLLVGAYGFTVKITQRGDRR